MDICEKKTCSSFISGDINLKRFILSKTSRHGSNAYEQLTMTGSKKLLRPRELCYLKVESIWLLMNSCKKTLFPLLFVEILICKGLFPPQTSKHVSNTY